MFFKLHSERKIGYKQLTKVDLGLTESHQTHIGLYDDIFTFLQDSEVEEKALLIYNNNIDAVDCYFDRIETSEGTFRSPKIKIGGKNAISVVTVIRDKAKDNPIKFKWYLIWFGLENEAMVFFFFNDHSIDYSEVLKILDLSKSGRMDETSPQYNHLLNYLENKVNVSGKKIVEELEIASQVGSSKKYRPFDLDTANARFKETGKKGEEIIARYLEHLKASKQIVNFTWYNKNKETGLPYDFSIQQKNQNIVYIDVKSTNFKFNQSLIFSNQEIEFIHETPNYNIYRVFDLSEEVDTPKLKICEYGKNLAKVIYPNIQTFRSALKANEIFLRMAKVAVKPSNGLLLFNNEINLKY